MVNPGSEELTLLFLIHQSNTLRMELSETLSGYSDEIAIE
jgi:hypothetical protein